MKNLMHNTKSFLAMITTMMIMMIHLTMMIMIPSFMVISTHIKPTMTMIIISTPLTTTPSIMPPTLMVMVTIIMMGTMDEYYDAPLPTRSLRVREQYSVMEQSLTTLDVPLVDTSLLSILRI